ncbi:MAG: aldo/keto reductase [Candidatus Hydrogenedentes bacterium]|nr:aldo/keto reductase [Candidatus Hydrogenedentota bacterium]
MQVGRREFLRCAALAAATAALPVPATAKIVNGIPYRGLGRTHEDVSLLGVGGSHIGNKELSDGEAIKIMRTAVDEGINFFDNAWEYNGGRSEERMGRALQDGYREKVFLMTKVIARDAENARKQLEASLRRLSVDHIDLWQVHSVGTFEPGDKDKVYSKGVLDVAMKAKDEGKVRYVGFSGHVSPEIHVAVIEGGFEWDTVQMPVNCLDPHRASFVKTVIPVAQQYNLGVIGMKSLAGGGVLKTGAVNAQEALLYAMSMPVSVVVSGMNSYAKFEQNLAVARSFRQLDASEVTALLARTKPFGEKPQYESYKQKGSSHR